MYRHAMHIKNFLSWLGLLKYPFDASSLNLKDIGNIFCSLLSSKVGRVDYEYAIIFGLNLSIL